MVSNHLGFQSLTFGYSECVQNTMPNEPYVHSKDVNVSDHASMGPYSKIWDILAAECIASTGLIQDA